MASITGPGIVSDTDLYSSTTSQGMAPGQLMYDKFGRKFRYVQNGGTALVVGNLIQSPARDTQFTGLAVSTAAAIGATSLALTNGTTTSVLNEFAGGIAVVSESTGIGQQFIVSGNDVATSGAALTVGLNDAVRTALTTSSKVTLQRNLFSKVIVSPTTRTGKTVGVAIYAVPADQYGWVQSGGQGAALSDATVAALGEGLSPSTTTAGTVTKQVTLLENVGTATILGVSAKVSPVWLMID